MDAQARAAVIASLRGLAASSDFADRADAGEAAAGFAGVPGAAQLLAGLVLDERDTSVTRRTAGALARRATAQTWRILALAAADADDNHLDWIDSAVRDAVGVSARDRDTARVLCAKLMSEADENIRIGARLLRETVESIEPLLFPDAGDDPG